MREQKEVQERVRDELAASNPQTLTTRVHMTHGGSEWVYYLRCKETTKRAPMDASFTSLKEVNDFALYGKTLKLVPGTTERSLMWMREAEIKHSRLAMLAAAGWPLAELWHGLFCKITGAQYMLDVTQGRSLSVLNGGLGEVWPFMLFLAISISAVECATLDQVYGLTATGMTMKSNE